MADFHTRDSFLKRTETFDQFLDINNLPSIPKQIDDESYVIDAAYNERPDLLAYDRYGSSRLWWVFALRNPDLIEDPIRDFKGGLEIKVPQKGVLDTILG